MKGIVKSGGSVSGKVGGRVCASGAVGSSRGNCPAYIGAYSVTPEVDRSVVLPTRDRRMAENVTVREIPLREVGNLAGGTTLIIG